MLKAFGAALALTTALALSAGPAFALQVVVTKMQKNANHTTTYHFSIRTDPGETLTPGEDFVTVYNFYGLVHGSAKSPEGWSVSSEEFGKTPTWEGYPAVMPVDIPGTPNLTWTPSSQTDGGAQVDGFSATTRASGTTEGEYSAQVTREEPGADQGGSKTSKDALIGHLTTPHFLAR
jgi:hypothetical protein